MKIMEELQLTETEQRYFGDLFLYCDSENTGKISVFKACDFFRTSKVPSETIKQIMEICTSGKSSHLGRKQFYTALKLIAASQAGLPIQPDLMNALIDVPLPKFSWTNDESETYLNNSPDLIQLSDNVLKSERVNSSDGEVEDKVSLKDRKSPGASSTASDSPTPTNSVLEKSWVTTDHWQGLVSEEQRQLLGTEEESSDRHSSEEETERELWIITSEQRDYYTAQFRSLQPDPNSLLAGSVARLFFEKSKLPVQELRKIWQLSDVTKDGALSLEEFNTAMHLVVLRRNNIPLPDSLPPSLIPSSQPPSVQPPPPPPAVPPRDENSPGQSSISSEPRGSKQWTKFVDSPTSSISSPGPKPVNFDFHKSAVEQDPKIFHPVPVRVTPEAPSVVNNEDENGSTRRLEYESLPTDAVTSLSHKKPLIASMSQDSSDIRPIQRPQSKKPPPGPGAIPPPPQLLPEDIASGPTSLPMCMAPKKEPPPPPPPRPYRTHARSSSLDLNKLGKSVSLGAPPAVPPRISPSSQTSPKKLLCQHSEGDVISLVGHGTSFADFAHFPGGEDEGIAEVDSLDSVPRRHGAFQVYRKHTKCEISPTEVMVSRHHGPVQSLSRLEEHNSLLARMCHELSIELADLQEERTCLQAKLERIQSNYNN